MTLLLNTIAQHPVAAFGLFVTGVIFGFLGLLHVLDTRAHHQIDEATAERHPEMDVETVVRVRVAR